MFRGSGRDHPIAWRTFSIAFWTAEYEDTFLYVVLVRPVTGSAFSFNWRMLEVQIGSGLLPVDLA